ncbi:hypothetical protein SDC9_134910 [bioreactor metagenome]|uniref:Uncharacterized protein n=1 Tax=bioreactor metagenome TaxID=1076179 RepID=A0A645DEC2_9ZZZZ
MFTMHMIHFQMFLMRLYPVTAFTVLVAVMLLAYFVIRKKLYLVRKIQIAALALLVIGLFFGMVHQYRVTKHDKAIRNKFGELVSPDTPFYKVTAGDETFYFMNPKEVNGRSMFYQNGRNIIQPDSVVQYNTLWAMDQFPVEVLEGFIIDWKADTMYHHIIAKENQH